jgi:DNA-binding response OmpR family regulator
MPIILLSAHQDMQRMAAEAGADDFLAKPFAMADLLGLAAKYLERASGEAEASRRQ